MSSQRSQKIPRPGRHSRHSRASRTGRDSIASRLTRLSLLEPTTREVGVRRVRWSVLALPLIVLALVFAIREVARVEKVLAAEGAKASRVITYQLVPGTEFRVPIEPNTDVFRVVAHVLKNGGTLAPQPHAARMVFTAKGEKGNRTDDVSFLAPGTTARVTPEDKGIVIGDPVGVNVDVHGIGVGELTIALAAVEGADAVVFRVYRRESLDKENVLHRTTHLSEEAHTKLVAQAGEIDWDDLDQGEQAALLASRWRRVAALRDAGKSLTARAIALAAPPPRKVGTAEEPAISALDLRGDEWSALIAHGKVTVRARADGDVEAKLVANLRWEDGKVDTIDGKGELTIDVPEGKQVGIELTRSSPGILSVRASDLAKVEPAAHLTAFRATPQKPLVINNGSGASVIRVTARRPVPRTSTGTTTIAMDATINANGTTSESVLLRANRARSPFDRYDVKEPSDSPSTSAVFHLLVPASGTLTLTPTEGPLDLAVAELDPEATPRPVLAYPAESNPPPVDKTGDAEWNGYVARRPSNWSAFGLDGRVRIRVPHRFVARAMPEHKAPSFRIKRPEAVESITRANRVFDPTTVTFEIDVPPGESLVLPVRIFAKEPMDVVAKIDGESIERRLLGAAERVTTPRKYAVKDEVRSVVVLGDDLPAGKHLLTFSPPPGKQAWVHLPWTAKPRLPGAPPPDPHWIEGDLED